MMNGGTDVDNNAVLFQKGAHAVLDPLVDAGKLDDHPGGHRQGLEGRERRAGVPQALTAAGGDVDGVLAANDDIANAVIGVLKNDGLDGKVVVTGQDSSVEGLQNIITGKQSMTIFKDVKLEATAAAAARHRADRRHRPGRRRPHADRRSRTRRPPTTSCRRCCCPPQVITQANVQDVIDAGALTADEICEGIEDDCSKLGIS